MKRYVFAFAAVVLLAGIAFAGPKSRKVLTINDVWGDPFAYKGTITITGVVADKSKYKKYSKDPKVFLIIDIKEAKICKQTGCARFYLPILFEQKHPTEWDEVNITGEFTEFGNRTVFAAEKVDVLRRLKF